MAKSNDPIKASAATKAVARNTYSGPSKAPPSAPNHLATLKMAKTGRLVESMPFNPNKPIEHGMHRHPKRETDPSLV